MQVVYKYNIPANREFTLKLPKGARILTVQAGKGDLLLWALVNSDLKHDKPRRFLPVIVGQPIPDELDLEFIGILDVHDFIQAILIFEIKGPEESVLISECK